MATSVDQKLLKSTKFPPEFNQKVDMQKVNLEVMKKLVAFSDPFSTVTMLTAGRV
jgi:serine/arginine repetitive matrix protein 1